jgi:hypothetical protein
MPWRIIFCLSLMLASDPPAPWVGTWKLNQEKSTSSSDGRYKRVMSRIEPWEDGLRVVYDMVGVRGGVTHMEWTGKFDGKDYPVEGVDYVLTNAYSRIDDHSYRIVLKVDGNVAATATVTVSPDGKTLTSLTTQKDSRQQTVTTSSIYERQ